jgi:hypothetical protein
VVVRRALECVEHRLCLPAAHAQFDRRPGEIPGGRLRAGQEVIRMVIERVHLHEAAAAADPFVREHAAVERDRRNIRGGSDPRQRPKPAEIRFDHVHERGGIGGGSGSECPGNAPNVPADRGRVFGAFTARQRDAGHERKIEESAAQVAGPFADADVCQRRRTRGNRLSVRTETREANRPLRCGNEDFPPLVLRVGSGYADARKD